MLLWYQVIALALIQGITEFLPISSSAHLIFPSQLLGWPDQGLTFDVAVHAGTLCAVIVYFRRDIGSLLHSCLYWLPQYSSGIPQQHKMNQKLCISLIIATIPAGFLGLLLNEIHIVNTRSLWVIATTTLVFGVLLGVADRYASNQPKEALRPIETMTLWDALKIGLAQSLALIPGTSRSGITITAALGLRFSREASARFSFLLSIPLIAAAGLLKWIEWLDASYALNWDILLAGFIVSLLSAFLCIQLFMAWIERIGLMPFVIYRIALALVLFAIAAS